MPSWVYILTFVQGIMPTVWPFVHTSTHEAVKADAEDYKAKWEDAQKKNAELTTRVTDLCLKLDEATRKLNTERTTSDLLSEALRKIHHGSDHRNIFNGAAPAPIGEHS